MCQFEHVLCADASLSCVQMLACLVCIMRQTGSLRFARLASRAGWLALRARPLSPPLYITVMYVYINVRPPLLYIISRG